MSITETRPQATHTDYFIENEYRWGLEVVRPDAPAEVVTIFKIGDRSDAISFRANRLRCLPEATLAVQGSWWYGRPSAEDNTTEGLLVILGEHRPGTHRVDVYDLRDLPVPIDQIECFGIRLAPVAASISAHMRPTS
jgi:hypothetical protein